MLPRDVYSWMGIATVVALGLVALLFLFMIVEHTIGMAVQRHVKRRQRLLLPLVLRAIAEPDEVEGLKKRLVPFDLRIVRDLLMRVAIDRHDEDSASIARVYDELGLLDRDIRCLYSLRSRTRRRAAANLGLLRPAAAVRHLLELLEDRQVNVRLAAIDAIGDIGCDQGLRALIPLLEDPDPAVAWRVQEAICRAGCDVGVPVVRYLEHTRAAHASRSAVESLRWIRPQRAEDRLRTIARVGRSRQRAQSAHALASIGSAGCEAALHVLLQDPHPEVRAQAARAMGILGRTASVPALRVALADASPRVRLEALRALVVLRESGITALLEELVGAVPEGWPFDVPAAAPAEGDDARARAA